MVKLGMMDATTFVAAFLCAWLLQNLWLYVGEVSATRACMDKYAAVAAYEWTHDAVRAWCK